MSYSLSPSKPSYPLESTVPHFLHEPYRGYFPWEDKDRECPARRGAGEVLWSLTAMYLAALIGTYRSVFWKSD